MSEFISEVFDGLKSISTCSSDIAEYAQAFQTIGNETMHDELISIYGVLQAAEERIREAVGKEVQRLPGSNS